VKAVIEELEDREELLGWLGYRIENNMPCYLRPKESKWLVKIIKENL
jgi:hypothetical protein